MSHVYHRAPNPDTAVAAAGCVITDAAGRTYLDAAGGAVASSIGHGDPRVAEVMARAVRTLDYVHATHFTSDALEHYADAVAAIAPTDGCRVYPVSGGSEAVETAIKLARAHHVARGEPQRHLIIGRRGSYHGNSRGALDASHRPALQADYEPWLGQTVRVPTPYPYRDGLAGAEHAMSLRDTLAEVGAENVAAFIAEPISGATLAGVVPPDDYWPAIAAVCREHGVLVIADEVMTGFGRTGTWFGADHWNLRPDIVTAGKGASSGYWPLGLCIAADHVHDAVPSAAFVHGFTWSHHPVGAAVAGEILRIMTADHLVDRARDQGALLHRLLREALADHHHVGEIRGRGLLAGVELVADRDSRVPFPRAGQVTERVCAAARERGVLLYPSTGLADGTDGDAILMGPPFVVTDDELHRMVAGVSAAIATI